MSPASGAARVRDAAPLFAALGDETRLALLMRISEGGPASLARLGERSRVSRQAIAKHMRVLSDAGLVTTRRRGRERICELDPRRLSQAHEHLDRIAQQWEDALGRLKAFVER
jgi:DNA-binding transcriptional ArsR family regulator